MGDGIGGGQRQKEYFGHMSNKDECASRVQSDKHDAIGVTVYQGNECYAQFDMTGTNGDSYYESCRFG